jgi:hypothetical protein
METQNIKSLLYESIANIDDNNFLLAVKEIIDRKYNLSAEPIFSQYQIERIEKSKAQIKSGKFLTNQQADNLVDKWLKE